MGKAVVAAALALDAQRTVDQFQKLARRAARCVVHALQFQRHPFAVGVRETFEAVSPGAGRAARNLVLPAGSHRDP